MTQLLRLSRPRTLCFLTALLCTIGAADLARGDAKTDKLYKALEHPRYKMRIQAAAALAQSGDERARPALEGLLADEEPLVRAAACDALMALGDPAAISAIRRATTDSDDTVRRRARLAIRVLRGLRKVEAKSLAAGAVTIESSHDRSEGDFEGVAQALQRGLEEERGKQQIALQALKRRYLLLSNVRSVVKRSGGDQTVVEAECDMTVAELPQRTLRLSTKVTAGATVSGNAGDAVSKALARDAAYGAGVELFKEFANWAVIQPAPRKLKKRR